MATLLGALLRNESGGRNIPNVHQGTSSGQAQGYFQITTGTWNDFGGQKYAKTPLEATYEQQADIASKIPLKRWDKSTLNAMAATGKPIDPNRTLGENLAMQGESFAGQAIQPTGPTHAPDVASPQAAIDAAGPNQKPQTGTTMPQPGTPGGAFGPQNPPGWEGPAASETMLADAKKEKSWREKLGDAIGGFKMPAVAKNDTNLASLAMPKAMLAPAQAVSTFDPNQQNNQRQQLAQAMQRLNSGSLWL